MRTKKSSMSVFLFKRLKTSSEFWSTMAIGFHSIQEIHSIKQLSVASKGRGGQSLDSKVAFPLRSKDWNLVSTCHKVYTPPRCDSLSVCASQSHRITPPIKNILKTL